MDILRRTSAACAALAAASALAAVASSPSAAHAAPTTVRAAADSWTNARRPTKSFGARKALRVGSKPSRRAFVRFVVPTLPGPVDRAVLRVHARTGTPAGIRVRSTRAGWRERALTHRNAPRPGARVAVVALFGARGSWRSIDVTRAVSGPGTYSFALVGTNARKGVVLSSKESGRAPRLVVTTAGDGSPSEPVPGTTIYTDRSWQCNGALTNFGPLPIKVVSQIPNPGTADAIRLIGCYGDGNPNTIDLILDVRGNNADIGTGYDAVKIGQNARDLVVTGSVACGATYGSIHQDVVQAMSGRNIEFRDFRSGNPETGEWTCWGAGGGWYVSHANGDTPTDLLCTRCSIATYNQNMRIDDAIRSGARDSTFGYSRSYGIYIGPQAIDPINHNNRVIRY